MWINQYWTGLKHVSLIQTQLHKTILFPLSEQASHLYQNKINWLYLFRQLKLVAAVQLDASQIRRRLRRRNEAGVNDAFRRLRRLGCSLTRRGTLRPRVRIEDARFGQSRIGRIASHVQRPWQRRGRQHGSRRHHVLLVWMSRNFLGSSLTAWQSDSLLLNPCKFFRAGTNVIKLFCSVIYGFWY